MLLNEIPILEGDSLECFRLYKKAQDAYINIYISSIICFIDSWNANNTKKNY